MPFRAGTEGRELLLFSVFSRSGDKDMAASKGGHAGLVEELVSLATNLHVLDGNDEDALMLASDRGHVAVCRVLLGHGAVMTTNNTFGVTALHYSAYFGHLQVGLLLCSKGADLMTGDNIGQTTLQLYGSHAKPPLSEETEEEHKAALLDCFRKGPHSTQVQRRKDENWARRWPLMLVMTGCDLRPVIARQLATIHRIKSNPVAPIAFYDGMRTLIPSPLYLFLSRINFGVNSLCMLLTRSQLSKNKTEVKYLQIFNCGFRAALAC